MKDLIELTTKISGKVQKEYLARLKKGTRNKAFFDGIIKKEITDEVQLQDYVTENAKEVNYSNYAVSKNRFIDFILQGLFHLDLKLPVFSKTFVEYYRTSKCLFAGRLLMRLGLYSKAITLINKAFKISDEFSFTTEKLECLKLLQSYQVLKSDIVQMEKIHKQVVQTQKFLEAEVELEYIYDQIVCTFSPKTGVIKDHKTVVYYKKLIKKAYDLKFKTPTRVASLNYFHIATICYEAFGNYKRVIKECDNALSYIDKLPGFERMNAGHFHFKKYACFMSLGNYQMAQAEASKIKKCYPKNSNNMLRAQMYFLLAQLHMDDFTGALGNYIKLESSYLSRMLLVPVEIEKWKVIKGYIILGLLYQKNTESLNGSTDKTDLNTKALELISTYSPEHLLEKCPLINKDLPGWKATIKILELLFLSGRGKHHELIAAEDALKIYTNRYFNKDTSERVKSFLKFITDTLRISSYSDLQAKYFSCLKDLEKIQKNYIDNEVLQEIIPLETLTKMHFNFQKTRTTNK